MYQFLLANKISTDNTRNGADTFELKRKLTLTKSAGAGELRIFFAESEMTGYEARKFADWLLRAAEYCDR